MPPEDDPRDEQQSWPCRKCNGAGQMIAQIHRLGLSTGGTLMLAAGCPEIREPGTGRVIGHAFVCPRCDGSGTDPDPTERTSDALP